MDNDHVISVLKVKFEHSNVDSDETSGNVNNTNLPSVGQINQSMAMKTPNNFS